MKTKQAKTMKTHPDKSGLSKEVYFFAKAYKLLVKLYDFRQSKLKVLIPIKR